MVQYAHPDAMAALLVISSFCAWKCVYFLKVL